MSPHLDVTAPSCETTVRQVPQFLSVADRIPWDAPLNVAFIEELSVSARLTALGELAAAGYRVRPIISARRIVSESQLQQLLDGMTQELGIGELLIVGGDPTQPAGPYATARELIESVPMSDPAVTLVGLPGFPKEHPVMSSASLLDHLVQKVQVLEASGRATEITTQVCLNVDAVLAWIRQVRARGIAAPIRIGIPAPTTAAKLLRFCTLCQVNVTADDLERFGWLDGADAGATSPSAFLTALAQQLTPDDGPMSTHVYPMGDVPAALAWWASLRQ